MAPLNLRHSVRALVLDLNDRILLCRHVISMPAQIVWSAPRNGHPA